jgi:hypothetical protein
VRAGAAHAGRPPPAAVDWAPIREYADFLTHRPVLAFDGLSCVAMLCPWLKGQAQENGRGLDGATDSPAEIEPGDICLARTLDVPNRSPLYPLLATAISQNHSCV